MITVNIARTPQKIPIVKGVTWPDATAHIKVRNAAAPTIKNQAQVICTTREKVSALLKLHA
jgi:hypothetical protein